MGNEKLSRRNWIKKAFQVTGGGFFAAGLLPEYLIQKLKGKTVLLHSSWQTVNIGDIGHTPGLVKLLNDQVPDLKIILWPRRPLDRGVTEMFHENFPEMKIIEVGMDADRKPVMNDDLKKVYQEADFMLHGSGPSVVGRNGLEHWRMETGKPYGIFGTTIQYLDDDLIDLLKGAEFVYTRETKSLEGLKEHGVSWKNVGFTPDATFAISLLDEEKAAAYLKANQLEYRKFICVIPRLRKTPYHKIYTDKPGWDEKKIEEVTALNNKHKEIDHAKAREAMITYVRETGNKILVCPEMTYQIDIMDELLIDPLPDDVKKNVVKRDTYWMPDEASSVYKQALALVSFECHSPIMAFAHGTPAMYLRQPEDTIKGQMWYDIGVDDWVFEIEETSGKDITTELMKIHQDFDKADKYRKNAMKLVNNRFHQSINYFRNSIGN